MGGSTAALYMVGAGSQPLYNGSTLAAESDVIVVTINYRLGALGFVDLSGIDSGCRSNVGLRDVLAALRWVRDNTRHSAAPQRVTLFGESAGAGIVTTLLAVPEAAGLFSRAIAQSSPVTSVYDKDRSRDLAAQLLDRLGMTLAEARQAPAQMLVEASAYLFDHVPTANRPSRIHPNGRQRSGARLPGEARQSQQTHRYPADRNQPRRAALFRFMKSP